MEVLAWIVGIPVALIAIYTILWIVANEIAAYNHRKYWGM